MVCEGVVECKNKLWQNTEKESDWENLDKISRKDRVMRREESNQRAGVRLKDTDKRKGLGGGGEMGSNKRNKWTQSRGGDRGRERTK